MKINKKSPVWLMATMLLILTMMASAAYAIEPYKPSWERWEKCKKFFDDNSSIVKEYPLNEIIPPEEYKKMVYDIPTMKKKWAEVVGFSAPDVVGKLHPEIKPGKYNYKEHKAMFKDMMPESVWDRFDKGGPPFAAQIEEFELIPTKQYYYSLRMAEADLKHMVKIRTTPDGYIIPESYVAGHPFPRPSGPHKAMQVVYNWLFRYLGGEDGHYAIERWKVYDRKFRVIFDAAGENWSIKAAGRLDTPDGYLDNRARRRRELRIANFGYSAPRDQWGNVLWFLNRIGTENPNQLMIWIAQIRRLRKLSGADSQDTGAGANTILDHYEGFNHKLSPTVYPYKFRMMEEREYIVPSYTTYHTHSIDSKTIALTGVEMERRPVYVVEMIQQDPSYVYAKLHLYIDKETYMLLGIDDFDHKGRKWRGIWSVFIHRPKMGVFAFANFLTWNYIDPQVEVCDWIHIPITWAARENTSTSNLKRLGK
jgi:hypothetical protein